MPRKKKAHVVVPDLDGRGGFLNNHARVLLLFAAQPTILQREAAKRLDITERAVQRIVAELQLAGYLICHREGRSNRYELLLDKQMSDDQCGHVTLGEFIELLCEK